VYIPIVQRRFTTYAPPCDAGNRYCEDNDTFSTAYGPLGLGVEYRAYPKDAKDYYVFGLSTAHNVTINLQNYQATGDLLLYDAAQTLEGQWGKGNSTMTIGPISLAPGTYYVLVYTAANTNMSTLYALTVTP
jgi:hypothetical protein